MTNARKNDPKMLSTNYFWELYQKWDDAGKNTIWGVAQSNYAMPERGIIAVSTASHGGIMMEQAYARRLLSPRGYALGAQSCEKGCKGWLFMRKISTSASSCTNCWSVENPSFLSALLFDTIIAAQGN